MKRFRIYVVVVASIFTTSCFLPEGGVTPLDPKPPAIGKGTLVLILGANTLRAKTLEPPLSVEVVSFDIRGSGPDERTDQFEDLGNTGGPLVVNGLTAGSWNITVDARNGDGTIIGHGQTVPPVLIDAGAVTSAQIDVAPLSGAGALNLTVQWIKGSHKEVSAQCSLTSMSTGVDLAPGIVFTPAGNPEMAICNLANIEAGYYLLLWRLYDGSAQFWGGAEAVRIIAGQITSHTWNSN